MSVEFEDNSIKIKELIQEKAVRFLYEAAGEIQAAAQRNSRVDTGQLKSSWKYNVNESDLEAKIGSPLENAIWEEFGTGEYALNGDGRKGGWFYEDAKGNGHFTYGKTPNRTLENAFTSNMSTIEKRAEYIFKELNG